MVGIICQLEWLNFVVNLLPTLWNLYLKHRCKKERFQVVEKKANVVPVHKKENKNFLKNYRPNSLLPIFEKIIERILFKDLFNYFHKNPFFYKMPVWIFTRWFLHLTVAIYCSRYQFFFWLWSNYRCQRCILRYFKSFW